jgi:cysteine desulfurase / selenocysteine lyase
MLPPSRLSYAGPWSGCSKRKERTIPSGGSLAPRADFPVLAQACYLNAASIALVPAPVRDRVRAFEEDISGRGTIDFDDSDEARVYEGVRMAAARLLNAAPDDIAVTTSATEALCQVAWWLRPGPGTNVVCVDLDFPSAVYPWYRVAEETGAEVRLIRALPDPVALSVETVAGAVDERTSVICVSHVQYATGHRFDLARLTEAARTVGAVLVVDATQSAGMVPIDVRADDIDVLVAGAYKWLCSEFGAAICYLRPGIAANFRPPFVGWRSTVDQTSMDATTMPIAPGARGLEYSTVAYPAGVALGAAIEYLLGVGIVEISEHDLVLARAVFDGLVALDADVITPGDEAVRGAIVTARFPGRDGRRLAARLAEARVYTSPRLGGVRFAPHLYNDLGDVHHGLEELERVLRTPADD